jgi:dolichol-phosphate mannosyltransferase
MVHNLVGNALHSEVGIILPTYKEADNISTLIDEIENLQLDASILVIDDSSPDGTAQIVVDKQKQYSNVVLYNRSKKLGLGTAITDGFKYYLTSPEPPSYVFTMDSDYSHNPQDIPKLLRTMRENNCAVVIGSRYSKGGSIEGWPIERRIVSKMANTLAQVALGLELNDCTSGFRCYSTEFLNEAINHLHSHTYEIQIETIRQAALGNFEVKETPVLFVNRKKGKSKLTWTEIKSFLSYIAKAIWQS